MKRVILLFVLVFTTIYCSAQKQQYQVMANASRNMQTQQFGSVTKSDMKILRNGNLSVTIGNTIYTIVKVNENIQTDSLSSVQFTAKNDTGEEFIIKLLDDPWAKAALMKNLVIVFATANPYDWTYYFCGKPERIE
nr:hypothetical protein [Prevotella sp.]